MPFTKGIFNTDGKQAGMTSKLRHEVGALSSMPLSTSWVRLESTKTFTLDYESSFVNLDISLITV